MISTLKRLQDKKAAQESNGGFTLIELLIVIVVLGILAAVVVFSLGSVTSKSAISACQADGATVNTAMSAYNANIGSYPTAQADLTGTAASGGPYLQSWPSNSAHYLFALSLGGKLYEGLGGTGTGAAVLPTAASGYTDAYFTTTPTNTGWTAWTGAATCSSTTVAG